jgi:hypothetical protein
MGQKTTALPGKMTDFFQAWQTGNRIIALSTRAFADH